MHMILTENSNSKLEIGNASKLWTFKIAIALYYFFLNK